MSGRSWQNGLMGGGHRALKNAISNARRSRVSLRVASKVPQDPTPARPCATPSHQRAPGTPACTTAPDAAQTRADVLRWSIASASLLFRAGATARESIAAGAGLVASGDREARVLANDGLSGKRLCSARARKSKLDFTADARE